METFLSDQDRAWKLELQKDIHLGPIVKYLEGKLTAEDLGRSGDQENGLK